MWLPSCGPVMSTSLIYATTPGISWVGIQQHTERSQVLKKLHIGQTQITEESFVCVNHHILLGKIHPAVPAGIPDSYQVWRAVYYWPNSEVPWFMVSVIDPDEQLCSMWTWSDHTHKLTPHWHHNGHCPVSLLTLSSHVREGYSSCPVCLCVCVFVFCVLPSHAFRRPTRGINSCSMENARNIKSRFL